MAFNCDRNLYEEIRYSSSGGSRKFERGVHRGQLNRRGFGTPINYNVRLLTSIRSLLLADVESDYSLMQIAVR